jgi:hypothetical protein
VEFKEKNWLKAFLTNEKLPEMLEVTGSVTAVPIDPDLNGATMGQAWLILKGLPGLRPSMTDAVSFRANCVAMKLNALRYHRRRYEEIQGNRVKEFSSNSDLKDAFQRGVKITEIEMLYEVEAFFSQYKSCLDMLVKVLCPITGLEPGTLSTYGDFGNRIIARLNRLKKTQHNLTVGRIDWLIEEIEKTRAWLESVIRIRDTYTHYRSEIHFGFEWDKALGTVKVPHSELDGKSHPLNFVMAELTEPLITYCANFIAITVSMAVPLSTGVQVMADDEKAYIGARWHLDLSRAIWKIASNVIRTYTPEDIVNAKTATAKQ